MKKWELDLPEKTWGQLTKEQQDYLYEDIEAETNYLTKESRAEFKNGLGIDCDVKEDGTIVIDDNNRIYGTIREIFVRELEELEELEIEFDLEFCGLSGRYPDWELFRDDEADLDVYFMQRQYSEEE